jgi:isoleucyl-tRNA synthetase
VVPWCPRCETAISQHEILTEDYKEVTHDSVYFKLPLKGRHNEYLLVWTTTPWTIPANTAVAVDSDFEYSLIGIGADNYWLQRIGQNCIRNDVLLELKNYKSCRIEI